MYEMKMDLQCQTQNLEQYLYEGDEKVFEKIGPE